MKPYHNSAYVHDNDSFRRMTQEQFCAVFNITPEVLILDDTLARIINDNHEYNYQDCLPYIMTVYGTRNRELGERIQYPKKKDITDFPIDLSETNQKWMKPLMLEPDRKFMIIWSNGYTAHTNRRYSFATLFPVESYPGEVIDIGKIFDKNIIEHTGNTLRFYEDRVEISLN